MKKRGVLIIVFMFSLVLASLSVSGAAINFTSPTPANGSSRNVSWVYVNVTTNITGNHSAWMDWNYSLYAWYNFDDRNSTHVFDNSTYGRHGLIVGNASYNSSGARGGAFEFDGDGDYITIGTGSDFSDVCLNGCTFSAWANINNDGTVKTIIARDSNSNDRMFRLQMNHLGNEFFTIFDDTTSCGAEIGSPTYGEWVHLVGVYNNDINKTYLYKNGVEVDNTDCTFSGINETAWQDDEPTLIGSYGAGSSNNFNGTIDEVMIWKRVLSPEEINATYNAGIYRLFRNFTGLSDGTYDYTAHAIDAAGNINQTETRTVTISDPTQPPTVTLNSPADNFGTSAFNISFNFTLTDVDGLKNATLYANFSGSWQANESNQTALTSGQPALINVTNVPEGSFVWNVYACDNLSNCGFAASNYSLTVDRINPNVNLVSPPNNSEWNTSNNVIFVYNVTDTNTISNCSLIVDGIINQTNTSITKDTSQNFTQTLSNGNYSWSVNCSDSTGNIGSSNTWNISVNFIDTTPSITSTLTSPANASTDTDGNITFGCSAAAANSKIVNISLYLNYTSWHLNQTNNVSGASNSTTFSIYNIPDDTTITWNCLACNNESNCSFAPANYTVATRIPNNITAASCNQSDVQAAIDNASYSDTVIIPAGNCTWSSGIDITKDLTIAGAGIDVTLLVMNFTNNSLDEGFFKFVPDATARDRLNKLSGVGIFDVSGITFYSDSILPYKHGVWIYNMNTPVIHRVKIHNNKYIRMTKAGYTHGYVSGVFYDNIVIDCFYTDKPEGPGFGAFVNNRIMPGSGGGWYYEDNNISTSGIDANAFGSGNSGGAYVVRYNTVTGTLVGGATIIDIHGNQLAGICGPQYSEVYGNNFSVSGMGRITHIRGGKALYFYNVFSGGGAITLEEEYSDNYSSETLPLGRCPDPYGEKQICTDDCICQKVHDTYFINNRVSATGNIEAAVKVGDYDHYNNNIVNNPPELVENEEYFQYNESFDGTSGTGCGTLDNLPATCTQGVGYWATEQSCTNLTSMVGKNPQTPISGTLFKCTSTNTWMPYYIPFDYPHYLVSGIPVTKVESPSYGTTTNNTIINFNCSVVDDSTLKNITLFGNWSGWHANETYNISSGYNLSTFTKTLSAGSYKWNCYACDVDGNCDWGNLNYTFTITSTATPPLINFTYPTPANGSTRSENWVYVNVTTNITGNHSAWIDWNRSLVGWWNFDDRNSTHVFDNSTYGRHGEINDNASYNSSGKRGGAFDFDGDGDYIDNSDIGINLSNDFTVSVWTKSDTVSAGMYAVGIGHSSILSRFLLGYEVDGKVRVLFREDDNTNIVNVLGLGNELDDNEFHHIVFVFKPGGSNSKIYVDGSSIWSGTGDSYTSVTSNKMVIGAMYYNGGVSNYWNGTIDEVMVWNRALSVAEINATYNAGSYRLFRNFTNLTYANYSYKAHVINESGSVSSTETRFVSLSHATLPPSITLNSPTDNSNVSSQNISFDFTATDLDGIKNATLYANFSGTWQANNTNQTVLTSGQSALINVTGLPEKNYIWNVYACDTYDNCGFASANYSFTVDRTAPVVSLESPANNTLENNSNTVIFSYNVSDTNNILNCSLILNNQINATNTTITKDASQNFTLDLSNGLYNWSVNCTDSANNIGASITYNLSVNITDNDAPSITLNTPINNFNTSSYNISFNFTATDSSSLKNATLYANFSGTWQANETNQTPLTSGQYAFINVTNVPEGFYIWNVYVCDTYNNCGFASANYTVTIDRTAPIINLVAPANNSEWNTTRTVTFTYNVSDVNNIANCSLILDGVIDQIDNTITKNINQTFTKDLASGTYKWSVNCTDSSGNTLDSVTYNLSDSVTFNPSVISTLSLPADNSTDNDGNITFVCNATAVDSVIVNISLYINYTSWHLNQTNTVTGTSNSTTFTLSNMSNGTTIKWNCLVCNNESNCSFASDNRTVSVSILGNYYYVRADATGANDGSDWTNAWTQLPDTLERDFTYYVADGNYSSYIFDDLENGTQYITIKKAIESDHGTNVGWGSSYGDSQAFFIFSNVTDGNNYALRIITSNIIIDGQTRNEDDWSDIDSYGFRISKLADGANVSTYNALTGILMPDCGGARNNNVDNINISNVAIRVYQDIYDFPGGADGINVCWGDGSRNNSNIFNNYFEGGRGGVTLSNSNNWVIENNYFGPNFPTSGGHCQQINPSNTNDMVLRNNYFKDSSLFVIGVHAIVGTAPCERWEVYNNIVDGARKPANTLNAVWSNADSGDPDAIKDWDVHHNTIVNIDGLTRGIFYIGSLSDPINDKSWSYNNIFYNVKDPAIDTNANYSYNAYYDCYSDQYTPGPNAVIGTGDPFVDSANGNFRLKEGVLAIDAGINLTSTFSIDRNGTQRPQASGWDMGAYEFNSSYQYTVVTLNSPLNNSATSNTTVIFNCSAIDNIMLSNITLYGNWSGGWHANETKNLTGTSNSTTFTKNLTDGTYIWNCLAYDNESNTDWANNYTLTIDSISPTINLVSPTNNSEWTSSNTIAFTYNVSDNSSITNCSLILNGIINQTNSSITKDTNQTFIQTLANGLYNWSVNCTDATSNIGASVTYNLSVDFDNPPTVSLDQPLDNYINSTQRYVNITFNATVTDDIGLVNCSLWHNISGTWGLNQSEDVSGTSNITSFSLNLTNISFIWNIECYDDEGQFVFNNTNRTATLNWTDTISPLIQFVTPTTQSNNHSQDWISANITATDIGLGIHIIKIYLYNSTNLINSTSNSTSPLFINFTLSDGTYYLNATANDTAGNLNSTETRIITLDTTYPNITFDFNGSIFNNSYFIFNFSVIEANPKTTSFCWYNITNSSTQLFYELLNLNSFIQNSSTYTYNTTLTAIADNNYNITINCTDFLNKSTQTTYNFIINDTTKPIITSISTSSSGTTTVTVTLSVTTDEASNCRYSTSNISYSNMSAMTTTGNVSHSVSRSYSSDSSGRYYARCNDTIGNVMNYSNSTTFNAGVTETTPPSGGGGGGGGGGAGTPTELDKVTQFWALIEAGTSVAMIISEEKIPMNKLTIDVINTVTNVEVSVTALAKAPVTEKVLTKKIYKYLEVSKINIGDENISKAVIDFSVNKSWLVDNKIKQGNIVLMRYDKDWKELKTTEISSTATKVAYRAETSGFSYFAITVKEAIKKPEELPEEVPEELPSEEAPPVEEEEVPEEAPPEVKPKLIYWQIIILVVLVISFIVVHRFLKREKTKK